MDPNIAVLGVGAGIGLAAYAVLAQIDERKAIRDNPPDILLTNYMMLELLLTRSEDRQLVKAAQDLKFLVFAELHTYRGRQGADVALLIRRCRQAFGGKDIICVGTSATMAICLPVWMASMKIPTPSTINMKGMRIPIISRSIRSTSSVMAKPKSVGMKSIGSRISFANSSARSFP